MPMTAATPGRIQLVKQDGEHPQGQTPDCTPLTMSHIIPEAVPGNEGAVNDNGRVPAWHGANGFATSPGATTNNHRSKDNGPNAAEVNGYHNGSREPHSILAASSHNPSNGGTCSPQRSQEMGPPRPVPSTEPQQPTAVTEGALGKFKRLATLQCAGGPAAEQSRPVTAGPLVTKEVSNCAGVVQYSSPPQRLLMTSQGSRPPPQRSHRGSISKASARDSVVSRAKPAFRRDQLPTSNSSAETAPKPKTKRASSVTEANMPGKKGQGTKKSELVARQREQVTRQLSKSLSQATLDPMAMLAAARKSHLPGADLKPEDKAQYQHVLSGKLTSLPVQKSKVVRIFLSSTFTDMTAERNYLMEKVYPYLKDTLREKYGLEFQVVDMRWGVRDEATDDHMTTELCMREIANCQRLSLGPTCVVFVGQKYGYRPIPSYIPGREFETLRDVVRDNQEDYDLLTKWYRCDENAIPSVYYLLPISSHLHHFALKTHPEKQRQDQVAWGDILRLLQRILRKGARAMNLGKVMSNTRLHDYVMSVTEREINAGVIEAPEPERQCMVYFRKITNLDPQAADIVRNYMDLKANGEVDEEASEFLRLLRETRIPRRLGESSIGRFEVEDLSPNGIDEEIHGGYLAALADSFQSHVLTKVSQAVEAKDALAEDRLYQEALHHSILCQKYVKVFQGREDLVERIRKYVEGPSDEPFLVYGYSGCGKTSLMAKAYNVIRDWLPDNTDLASIARFLGSSPDSSAIVPLLRSVCLQIRVNYPPPGNKKLEKVPDDISPLCVFFKKLLMCATAEKPLVVFFDSLDQLSPIDGAHDLSWLPIELPAHVKFVVSCAMLPDLPDIHIVENFTKMVDGDDDSVLVPSLGTDLSRTIITTSLESARRKVSGAQWAVISAALEKCNLSLFVRLVLDRVLKWKSYTPAMLTILPATVHDCIMELLKDIEKRHGHTLVSHALRYLTASKRGLSEAELEDILSLDEEVLNDVFQYHIPPVRRIAPLLWTRIYSDMPDYLNEREADGTNVIDWYHRQFQESVHSRYFRNINLVQETHSILADYFQGIWGGQPKPFQYTTEQANRFGLHETEGECDRRVPTQPLYYKNEDGKITHYNLRKLSELPYHLLKSERIDELYDQVLFNYEWLHTKLTSFSLSAVIEDYEIALAFRYDRDVRLVAEALRLSTSLLAQHPNMLGPQLLGRLMPYRREHAKIRLLLDQCDTVGVGVNALVPSHHCLHTPGGPLHFILSGHPRATFSMAVTADQHHLVSISSILLVYDLHTGEISRKVNPGIRSVLRFLSVAPDDRHALCVTHNDQLLIVNLFTGEHKLIERPTEGANVWGTCAARTHALVYSKDTIYFYEYDGKFAYKNQWNDEGSCMVDIYASGKHKRHLVFRTGIGECPGVGPESPEGDLDHEGSNAFEDTTGEMRIEVQGSEETGLTFRGPYFLSEDRKVLFVCNCDPEADPAPQDEDGAWCYDPVKIERYNMTYFGWELEKAICKCNEIIFYLVVSADHQYVAAATIYGFKIWHTLTGDRLDLRLEEGVRNIPNRKRHSDLMVFTRDSRYLVTAVREKLYVWDVKTGVIAKTLTAHYKRILSMLYMPRHNKIITSSFDTSIKVWNFDNLSQPRHPLDRHAVPVEKLDVAAGAPYAVAAARGDVGFWNLRSGRMRSLSADTYSSMMTQAVISADGKTVVSAESGTLHIWDMDHCARVYSEAQRGIQQLMLVQMDTRVLSFSHEANGPVKCVCRKVADGSTNYTLEYTCSKFVPGRLSYDGLYLLAFAQDDSGSDIIRAYHARTGTMLYDIALKFAGYKSVKRMIAIPRECTQIGLVDADKVDIIDIKAKSYVRSISHWNGQCSADGAYGLVTPATGGLQVIDLKTGKQVKKLLTGTNEGMFQSASMFVGGDRYILYYHGRRHSITLVRMEDSQVIAEYHLGMEARDFKTTSDGGALVVSTDDGSVTTLFIVDPLDNAARQRLQKVPNRFYSQNLEVAIPSLDPPGAGKISLRVAAKVAALPARMRNVKATSKACVIS